jgi:Aspartyl protease
VRLIALALSVALLGATTTQIVIENNVLLLHAVARPGGNLLFVFDPGAGDFLTEYGSQQLKTKAPNLRIGDADLHAVMPVLPGDSNAIVPRHDAKLGTIAGSLGPALVRRYAVTINYRAASLTLTPASQFSPPPDAAALPFDIDETGMPIVTAMVDGVEGRFKVDVRAPTSMLYKTFADKAGLSATYAGSPVLKRAAYGVQHAVHSIEIGSLNVQNPVVWFSNETSGQFASSTVAGLIGNNVLSHCILQLDYARKRVYVGAPHL